jgi:hypothetical protein
MNEFRSLVAAHVAGGGSGIGATTASLLQNRGHAPRPSTSTPLAHPAGRLPLRTEHW